MKVNLVCDKCDALVHAATDAVQSGFNLVGGKVAFTFTAPEGGLTIVTLPNGQVRLFCATCLDAYNTAIAGF